MRYYYSDIVGRSGKRRMGVDADVSLDDLDLFSVGGLINF